MQHEVGWWHGQQHAGHAADDEGHHEGNRPHHRQIEGDAATVHGEQPVEYLGTRRDRDDHGCDAKEGVDAGARAHGEEVVQPHQVGQHGDGNRGVDHRRVAKQTLAAVGGDNFGVHAEQRQDQDVDLGVAPDPDQVHVHHGVAAELGGEEVGAGVAIQAQQGQHGGQHREGGNDQHVGAQGSPGEHGHLHHGHAGCAHLDDGGQQVDARQQRSDPRQLQRPDVVVNPHVRTVDEARQRRIRQPAGLGKFTNKQ